MRSQTCCFTGHRQIPVERQLEIVKRLEKVITRLYQKGVRYYGAGGARGFDTLAAQAVLRLRKSSPGMKLIQVLPCITQSRGWSAADILEYERIKGLADKVVYTSQEYTNGCMLKRNRHLVDHSSVCVCYMTKDSGGTAYTVRYAKGQGLDVINLAASE